VDGARGSGEMSVPVPALATQVLGMQKAIGTLLAALGLLLCIGLISIAGASVRDAPLEAGVLPDPARRRRSRMVMAGTAVFLAGALYAGAQWWDSEDGFYRRYVFKPLEPEASLASGNRLTLQLHDPGWLNRRTDDLLPDHDHLMHLYVLRLPAMELVWHLHPRPGDDGGFVQLLPDMPAGRYALFGDIVHANGLPETAVGEIELPAIAGTPLTGDDAAGAGPPLAQADYNRSLSPLSDGYTMSWDRGSTPLHARRPYLFRFSIHDPSGRPAADMQLYMGMLGHVAFIRSDRSVFAHVHPSGSVPMPALMLAQPADSHAAHRMAMDTAAALPAEVSFPYGFPKAGDYRIVVQVKRAGKIQTGVFDARVEN
jgi:hypothetical protein